MGNSTQNTIILEKKRLYFPASSKMARLKEVSIQQPQIITELHPLT